MITVVTVRTRRARVWPAMLFWLVLVPAVTFVIFGAVVAFALVATLFGVAPG